MAYMVMIYRKPADESAFKSHYSQVHIPLAKQLPGLQSYEVSESAVTLRSTWGDAWFVAVLRFDDMTALRAAFASEIGKACALDRQILAPDPADFQMLLLDTSPALQPAQSATSDGM